jgi:Domain of unknown function (DUF4262)
VDRNSQNHPPAARDDQDRKLLTDIEQYGWHVVGVEQDDEGPGFVYSVGLYRSFGHPEILVIGLAIDLMFGMVNGVGELVREGKRFEHLDESGDVLDEFNVAFRQVELANYNDYLGCAQWFHQGDDFPVLQCVWPDSQRRYPWHPDYSTALRERQPVLSDSSAWPFHEGRNRACFTTRRVLDGLPIVLVSRDVDGDWQFLCGTTNEAKDGALVCLGDMFGRDGTLAEVADLPQGWRAERPKIGGRWVRSTIEVSDNAQAQED